MPTEVLTGAARIVWGNPLKPRPKLKDKVPVLKDGKPVQQWSFGIAIPAAEMGPITAAMIAEANKLFTNGVYPPNFAWKYKDGINGIDTHGKRYADREGYAGCYVLAITTEAQAPNIVRLERGVYVAVTDTMKTGDYVRVGLSLNVHPAVNNGAPGLYLNPQVVEWIGQGPEIYQGADPDEILGGTTVALPAGATAIGAAPTVAGTPPGFAPPPGQPAAAPIAATPPGYVAPGNPQFAPPGIVPAAAPPPVGLAPTGQPPGLIASPSSPPGAPPPPAPLVQHAMTAPPAYVPPPPVQAAPVAPIVPYYPGYHFVGYNPDGSPGYAPD